MACASGRRHAGNIDTSRLERVDRRHSLPQMLPDGRGVLYTMASASNYSDGQIAVMSLATGETHVVLDQGIDARYIPSGHLVYVHDGTLMAVPFDLQGLRVTGTPVVNRERRHAGTAHWLTSASAKPVRAVQRLGYRRPRLRAGRPVPEILKSLVWVSRNGTVTPTNLPPGPYGGPRLSPDGSEFC